MSTISYSNKNFYSNVSLNPQYFSGSDIQYIQKHNLNIGNTNKNSFSEYIETNKNMGASSNGGYMIHSYFGNAGSVIRSCNE